MPTRYGERYTLMYPLAAVRRTSGNSIGCITRIPKGSTIQIDGDANESGMVAVHWRSDLYQVFEADILDKGRRIEAALS